MERTLSYWHLSGDKLRVSSYLLPMAKLLITMTATTTTSDVRGRLVAV